MRKIVVCGREIEIPSPIYILPDTIKVSEETGTVSGKCLFPSSDPSVGERVDHANVCHAAFTLWNAAHIFAASKGWGRLFAIDVHQKVKGMMPPDTEIDFVASITNVRKRSGRIVGSAKATFSLDGKTLLLMDVRRFIEEKI